ncbi:MAG: flagellar basal body P-ring protein FlgI [Planctomycetota bacterium]
MVKHTVAVVGGILCAALGGCWPDSPQSDLSAPDEAPLHIRGTVGEHAVLRSGRRINLQGYGLVVGLGEDGSSQIPPKLRKYFTQDLLKEKLGSHIAGTQGVTPRRLIEDMDTAAVLIGGSMPPGALKGTRFDVFVSALPQTGTRSLVGGVLMPADMHMAVRGRATPGGPSRVWAESGGSVFVNPFIDPTDREQAGKLRRGRVIGGGVVTRAQSIRLELREPGYALSRLIERRLNERFGGPDPVAFARSRSVVEIKVPRAYRREYESFLRLMMHLPLHSGAPQEARARQIIRMMTRPGANHDELALVLEAMGRQVTSLLTPLYTAELPAASFHAARTGLRLGDTRAVDVLVEFARTSGSAFQIPAIEELGRRRRPARALSVLRTLVNVDSETVRVAAYRALRHIGDSRTVERRRVGDEFDLDVVRTTAKPVIYATRTQSPRIVVFGRDIRVRRPVFFTTPDETITVTDGQKHHRLTAKDVEAEDIPARIAAEQWGSAQRCDEIVRANPDVDWDTVQPGRRIVIPPENRLLVWRTLPRGGRLSEVFYLDHDVLSLIEALGSPARLTTQRRVQGLNLTYGQVVGVLYRMCERGDIPAKFVLQPVPEGQTMAGGA